MLKRNKAVGVFIAAALIVSLLASRSASGEQVGESRSQSHRGPECVAVDRFFADEVWAKIGERSCLKCHNPKGEAAKSKFVLLDTTRDRTARARNQAAFVRMAKAKTKGKSRLLARVAGGLDHGGGEVLKSGSTGYRILQRFVRRVNGSGKTPVQGKLTVDGPPFFQGVQMISPPRLLRRVTLSLAGRLPTEKERAAVKKHGLKAMDAVLDGVMKEETFYERLKEGFNDIFLTRGYEGNGEEVLSYAHFNRSRTWHERHDLSHVPAKERKQARWRLGRVYRETLRREPLELIAYIVRNNRPFTELVTADYILVSPYSSRGYGIFKAIRSKFKNPDDPFEYVPTRLRALKRRSGKVQESRTGFYPHSGFLTMFHYLRRYPTTETNRNRLRARMYYRHFLGVDVMALAPRVTDAAALTAKYKIPTMQAADCVVCHKSVDPLAGLFQAYDKGGHFSPRKEGWYSDMFGPGFEGTSLPEDERWRSLQWLGQRTARDPRFAKAMVEHVYYILMGRNVLKPPEDIDDPLFGPRRRAYREQREMIEETAERFVKAKFNLKVVFKLLVNSKFYRADGLATAAKNPRRRAELHDVGLVRLLTPEQLERKIQAVFGKKWGRMKRFHILYGGINSQTVTERMTDPSGAMGAIQRMMANDVACKNVAVDFTKEPDKRRLFPGIEPGVVPGKKRDAEKKIRKAIVHLYAHLHGRRYAVDHSEVNRTYKLFAGIVADAKATRGWDKQGTYFCERVERKFVGDPHYTIRAWRGVVTYLLRQHDFLYE